MELLFSQYNVISLDFSQFFVPLINLHYRLIGNESSQFPSTSESQATQEFWKWFTVTGWISLTSWNGMTCGIAHANAMTQTIAIILTTRLSFPIACARSGWQMARYLRETLVLFRILLSIKYRSSVVCSDAMNPISKSNRQHLRNL